MADSTDKPDNPVPDLDRNHLINRIDELEKLLTKKKAESKQTDLPRLKVGTDGIPVLVETVTEEDISPDKAQALNKDDEVINDIINKVDKEITEDLDELIVMLKDSIIDEVKTRLLKELHINEDKTGRNQNNK